MGEKKKGDVVVKRTIKRILGISLCAVRVVGTFLSPLGAKAGERLSTSVAEAFENFTPYNVEARDNHFGGNKTATIIQKSRMKVKVPLSLLGLFLQLWLLE